MHNNIASDRDQLQDFLGMRVDFKGLIVNTKKPSPDKHFICLRRMDVCRKGETIRCHHMWLDVSDIKDMTFRLTEWMTGSAYVKHYRRMDGSVSYGMTPPLHIAAA